MKKIVEKYPVISPMKNYYKVVIKQSGFDENKFICYLYKIKKFLCFKYKKLMYVKPFGRSNIEIQEETNEELCERELAFSKNFIEMTKKTIEEHECKNGEMLNAIVIFLNWSGLIDESTEY